MTDRIMVYLGDDDRRGRLEQVAARVGAIGQRGPSISKMMQMIADNELRVDPIETEEAMNDRYYPILVEYVGPNPEQHHALTNRIRVNRKPGVTNQSRERRTNGWLGTTNGWSKTALGEMSESGVRRLLKTYGVKIPDHVSIEGDFSFGHKTSEWWNRTNTYSE